jgi:HEAT repeat protein
MSRFSFSRNKRLYVLLSILFLTLLVGALTSLYPLADTESTVTEAKPLAKIPHRKPKPEEIAMLLERMAAPQALTQNDIEEEIRMNREFMERARKRLASADSQQRRAGAEQLSAYPNPEAEKLLAQALLDDSEPDVQSASARSLVYIRKPGANALDALQQALQSKSAEVAFAALYTLENYVAREPFRSVAANDILIRLKQAGASSLMQEAVQTAVGNFLDEQLPEEANPKTR